MRSGAPAHSLPRTWTAGLIAILLASILAAGPASATAGAYCANGVVRDYAKPLKSLPKLRAVPFTNRLPFGPSGLFLSQGGTVPFVVRDEEFGFSLSFSHGISGRGPSPRLDWTLTAALARIDRRGKVRDVLHTVTRHVARMGNGDDIALRLPFQFQRGLYRLEIVFENQAGKRLGRFGSYLRALRTDPDSRLTLNGSSFRPGDTVTAQAQEYGIGWISLGDTYSIEIYSGDAWTRSPISPKQLSLLIGPLLGPGAATSDSCWSFTIPTNAPPGLYRFVVDGTSLKPAPRGFLNPSQRLSLVSEFQILPAGGDGAY